MSKRRFHSKNWDSNLPMICTGARDAQHSPQGRATTPVDAGTRLTAITWAAESMLRLRRRHNFGHGFQHSAEIAVGRNDRGRIFFERSAHYVEAAQKRIEFLRVRRAERGSVDRSRFGVGFAFD